MDNKINNYFKEIQEILSVIDTKKIKGLVKKINEIKNTKNTIYIIGNGGSASTASHWVCDLIKGTIKDYNSNRNRLRTIALADNVATISAYANDISYDEIFSQQLRNLINKNDLLIAMSGSGKSRNIINAVEIAKEHGAYTFGLLGGKGGSLASKCDDSLIVPSKNYGIIEDVHLMVGHLVTLLLKEEDNIIS